MSNERSTSTLIKSESRECSIKVILITVSNSLSYNRVNNPKYFTYNDSKSKDQKSNEVQGRHLVSVSENVSANIDSGAK